MSSELAHLGHDSETARDLYLWTPQKTLEIGQRTKVILNGPFICVLVWDASSESEEIIASVTEALLRAGCVYLCAWGTDCERVHDICDAGIVQMTLDEELSDDPDKCVMTT